jgi:hypothetical protein
MCKNCHGEREQRSLRQHSGLKLKEETSEVLDLEQRFLCMVLKLRHCGSYLGSFEMWCWREMENIS